MKIDNKKVLNEIDRIKDIMGLNLITEGPITGWVETLVKDAKNLSRITRDSMDYIDTHTGRAITITFDKLNKLFDDSFKKVIDEAGERELHAFFNSTEGADFLAKIKDRINSLNQTDPNTNSVMMRNGFYDELGKIQRDVTLQGSGNINNPNPRRRPDIETNQQKTKGGETAQEYVEGKSKQCDWYQIQASAGLNKAEILSVTESLPAARIRALAQAIFENIWNRWLVDLDVELEEMIGKLVTAVELTSKNYNEVGVDNIIRDVSVSITSLRGRAFDDPEQFRKGLIELINSINDPSVSREVKRKVIKKLEDKNLDPLHHDVPTLWESICREVLKDKGGAAIEKFFEKKFFKFIKNVLRIMTHGTIKSTREFVHFFTSKGVAKGIVSLWAWVWLVGKVLIPSAVAFAWFCMGMVGAFFANFAKFFSGQKITFYDTMSERFWDAIQKFVLEGFGDWNESGELVSGWGETIAESLNPFHSWWFDIPWRKAKDEGDAISSGERQATIPNPPVVDSLNTRIDSLLIAFHKMDSINKVKLPKDTVQKVINNPPSTEEPDQEKWNKSFENYLKTLPEKPTRDSVYINGPNDIQGADKEGNFYYWDGQSWKSSF